MIRRLILFLVLGGLLASSASASVSIYSGRVQVTNEPLITPSEINTKLGTWITANPSYAPATQYIEEVEPNVWLYRKCVHFYNSTVEFNGSKDCVELRLGTTQLNPGGFPDFGTADTISSMIFKDTTIRCWNETANNQPIINISLSMAANMPVYNNMSLIYAHNLQATNVSFHGVNKIIINTMYENTIISNVTINDSFWGMETTGLHNVTFSGIHANNLCRGLLLLSYYSNIDISDISIHNPPEWRWREESSSNGIAFGKGNHSQARDLYFDGPLYSGVYFSGGNASLPEGTVGQWPHDIYVENCTTLYAGHNGIDIHSGYNITLKNFNISKSLSNNIYITGPWGNISEGEAGTFGAPWGIYGVYNVTIDTAALFMPQGMNLKGSERISHITLKNISFGPNATADRTGVYFFGADNVSSFNISAGSLVSSPYVISSTSGLNVINSRLFDSYITGSSYSDIFLETMAKKSKIINSKYSIFRVSADSDYGRGYYLDVSFKNATGYPIQNAEYTVTSNNSAYSPSEATAYCVNKTNFVSTSSGRSYSPAVDRSETPVVYDIYTDAGIIRHLSTNVSSGGVTLDNIIPDTEWYRGNLSQPEYTITAINNESTDLHLTGFAPSTEYNIFDLGDPIKFQVWSNDDPLDSVTWKKDGVVVQNGGSTYTTTVSGAPITVDLIGESSAEVITKTWIVDPDQVIVPDPEIPDPEDPDPEEPVTPPTVNFTATPTSGVIRLNVQFNDTSINATNWYWDFDNNGVIDSTVQNPVCKYKTAGNYTVKLTVSNAGGMDTETKTDYITATKQSYLIYVWNWFSNIFLTGGAIFG